MEDHGPVACSLAPADLAARGERWLHLSEHALLDKKSITAGVRLQFRKLEGVERELRALAALERKCCSYATWSVTDAGGHLTLEVTAEGEGVAAVRALFDAPAPAPAGGR